MTEETTAVEENTTTEGEGETTIATSREEAGSNLERNSSSSSLLELNEEEALANEPFKVPEKFLKDGEADVENLVKSYTELETKLRTTRPNAPASADDYSFDFPEGFDVDDKATTEFKKEAHEKGLSQDQFEWVMKEYLDTVATTMTESTPSVEKAEKALKEVWGDGFEDQRSAAQLAWKTFGGDLDVNEVGNNPVALQVLAKIGATLKEDGVTSGVAETSSDVGISDEEMYALQNHPKYWDSPQIQEKVAGELGRRKRLGLPQYRP